MALADEGRALLFSIIEQFCEKERDKQNNTQNARNFLSFLPTNNNISELWL